MKFLRLGKKNEERPAVIDIDGSFRDISSIIKDLSGDNLSDETLNKIKKENLSKLPEIPKDTRIGQCVSNPSKFIGIGLNYSDHAEEQNLPIPKEPIVFFKSTSCICGPYDEIIVPKNSKKTDWEVELGLVIGKKAQYIDEKDALKFIFGFFLVNDLTERSWQKERSGQWVKGKSADTFGPIGPFLITKDDLIDYQNLDMFLDVDNKRMQIGNTNKMIYKINFLVSYLSQFMTLNPGDIITTGTPPGVGENKKPPIFLNGGETIQLGITNLGIQKHKVISYK